MVKIFLPPVASWISTEHLAQFLHWTQKELISTTKCIHCCLQEKLRPRWFSRYRKRFHRNNFNRRMYTVPAKTLSQFKLYRADGEHEKGEVCSWIKLDLFGVESYVCGDWTFDDKNIFISIRKVDNVSVNKKYRYIRDVEIHLWKSWKVFLLFNKHCLYTFVEYSNATVKKIVAKSVEELFNG